MSLSPILRELIAAGLSGEALISAVERIEAAREVDKGAVRAARNKRYREKKKALALAGNETPKTLETQKTSRASQTSQASHGVTPNDPSPLPPHTPPITPTPNTPGSDPDGSAPTSGASTQPDDAEPDFRTELFRRGLDAVCRLTGTSPAKARALVGAWLGKAGDEAVIVLRLIDDAEGRKLIDPTSWIEAQLRRRRDDRPAFAGERPARPVSRPRTARDAWAEDAIESHQSLQRKRDEQCGFDDPDGPAGGPDAGRRDVPEAVRECPPGEPLRLPAYGHPRRRRAVG